MQTPLAARAALTQFRPFLGGQIILEIWSPVRAGRHEARRASPPNWLDGRFVAASRPRQDANSKVYIRVDG